MASSTRLNSDVLTVIFLLLPFQSILRLRAVCRYWRDIIDSSSFQKLHINNNGDDIVYLLFTFLSDYDRKLSIKLLHNGKLLNSYSNKFTNEVSTFVELMYGEYDKWHGHHYIRLVGPVKGLVCIYSIRQEVPIALCNPFLGQLEILPNSSSSSSSSKPCRISRRDVAIGYAGEDYKVVQLMHCSKHYGLHAQLYSGKTDSWRELGLDGYGDNKHIANTIKSSCKNGSFAHWEVFGLVGDSKERFILSLDMENEVFQTIMMRYIPNPVDDHHVILAEDKDSFLLFVLAPHIYYSGNGVLGTKIYESRCEGSKLRWIPMMNVEETPHIGSVSRWMRTPNCVVLKTCTSVEPRHWSLLERNELIVYEYGARRFIERSKIPAIHAKRSEVVEYKGSFVSIHSKLS